MAYDFSKLVLNKAGKILKKNNGLIVPFVEGEPVPPGPGPEPSDPIEDYQITRIFVYDEEIPDPGSTGEPYQFNIIWDPCTVETFEENIQESKYEVTLFEDGVEKVKEIVSYDEEEGYLNNGIYIPYVIDGNKVYTVDVIAINSYGKRSKSASELGKWEDDYKNIQLEIYDIQLSNSTSTEFGYYISGTLSEDESYKIYNGDKEIESEYDIEQNSIVTTKLVPGTTYNLKLTGTDKLGANAIPGTFNYVAEDPLSSEEYTYMEVTAEPYFDEGSDEITLNCTIMDNTDSKILNFDKLTLKIYDNDALNGIYPIDESLLNNDVSYTISEPSMGEHTIKLVLESNHGASQEKEYQVEVNKCTLIDNYLMTDISISEGNEEVRIDFSTSNPILEEITCELYDENGNYYDVTDAGSGSEGFAAIPLDNLYDNGYQPGDTVYFTLNINCNHGETLTSDCDIQLPEI